MGRSLQVVLSLHLEPSVRHRLQVLSKFQHRPIHWLAVQAIKQYVNYTEANLATMQLINQRWQEATTGHFVTHDQVLTWLQTS